MSGVNEHFLNICVEEIFSSYFPNIGNQICFVTNAD